ncbi:MAG: hypothetical protein QF615_10430 [Planctomycetota bacterium]|jgi:hypothetical protein|nr:hypothetical protein [Planctomycetota bacterium]
MNISRLKERADADQCSAPMCRHESVIAYSPGATEANLRKRLAFCDRHHNDFCKQLDSDRRARSAEEVQA